MIRQKGDGGPVDWEKLIPVGGGGTGAVRPKPEPQEIHVTHHKDGLPEGMTLLDWFLGHAIAGVNRMDLGKGRYAHDVARDAYDLAEAMLAEKRRRENADQAGK